MAREFLLRSYEDLAFVIGTTEAQATFVVNIFFGDVPNSRRRDPLGDFETLMESCESTVEEILKFFGW